LKKKYSDISSVRKLVRRSAALPLVKLDEIDSAWLIIENDADRTIAGVISFLDYLCDNWIDETKCKFSRRSWNKYGIFKTRTNNNLEGYHNRLNKSIGRSHPSIHKFVENIKIHQNQNESELKVLKQGHAPPPMNAKYREVNRKLTILHQQFEDNLFHDDMEGYLDACGNAVHIPAIF
jgi:hypothetical protein